MIGAFARRFYHVGKTCFASGSSSSSLGKLRKATGYSVSNCKKALEMFPDNVQKAEEWLHNEAKKMGWSKWNKIQSRSAIQGIIGVHTENTLGIMIEVNCETDFVAKNAEFQELLGYAVKGCLINEDKFVGKTLKHVHKVFLDEGDLLNMKCANSTMQELVNSAMCKFNEKVVLKRALLMKVPGASGCNISGLTHPSEVWLTHPHFPPTSIGKFGVLLACQQDGATDEDFKQIGSNICQHIIGMNPQSIGMEDFLYQYESGRLKVGNANIYSNPAIQVDNIIEEKEQVKDSEVEEESLQSNTKESDENRLLFQPYLLDQNVHVYDYMWEQAKVIDFERFECGGVNKKPEIIENIAEARM